MNLRWEKKPSAQLNVLVVAKIALFSHKTMPRTLYLCLLVCLSVFPFSSAYGARISDDRENRLAIQSIIVSAANEYGVDPGLAIFIAANESGFLATAKSKTSSASGIFQWIKKSWLDICITQYQIAETPEQVFDPVLNIQCAVRTLAEPGGLRHWLADPIMFRLISNAGFLNNYDK